MFVLERIKYLFSGQNLIAVVVAFVVALIFNVFKSEKFQLKRWVIGSVLWTVVALTIVYMFFAPLHAQQPVVIDTKCYEMGRRNYVLYATGEETQIVLQLDDENEWKFPAKSFRIEVRTDIDSSFLAVSTELEEQIYLHKTEYEKQEKYTLYIKSGE